MPYINIREQDIQTVPSFDVVRNAVLIFGPDFHRFNEDVENADDPTKQTYPKSAYTYKLYTSVVDFVADVSLGSYKYLTSYSDVYRPYVTAYDCLLNGLPVIYVPIDDFVDNEFDFPVYNVTSKEIYEYTYGSATYIVEEDEYKTDSEGNFVLLNDGEIYNGEYSHDDNGYYFEEEDPDDPTSLIRVDLDRVEVTSRTADIATYIGRKIDYNFLGVDSDLIVDPSTLDSAAYAQSIWGNLGYNQKDIEAILDDGEWTHVTVLGAESIYKNYTSGTKNAMKEALKKLLEEASSVNGDYDLPLGDRVNMPITFITTCGYETDVDVNEGSDQSLDSSRYAYESTIMGLTQSTSFGGVGRLDFVYLYDIPAEYESTDGHMVAITPEKISRDPTSYMAASLVSGELCAAVYPWATYASYRDNNKIHMPGSYGFLMAYANSVKNNAPWLATAGVNRGRIPNIINVDYKIREAYVHLWQGDDSSIGTFDSGVRINPILDIGSAYGVVIFGNRTCYDSVSDDTNSFKRYLNVRMLLVNIHKQVFLASLTHMFEPNDDLVWLSFKQKANLLLDEMVSGRGLKWYKWKRIRTDKLGLIRAQLTIRPIEAIEAFDILIAMTDSDIEVQEG